MSDPEAALRRPLMAHVIFVRYVLFAVISSAANLLSQAGVAHFLPAAPIVLSILVGTGVGFVIKYLLDKNWIFLDAYESHATEARKVLIYGFSSVGTTVVFWGTELAAWSIWQTSEAKYIGGAVGLALGNWIKYHLDRNFAFAGRGR